MNSATTSGGDVLRFKVVLLGEGAVGKTSVVLRYVENKFNPKHLSTLQASFMTKKLNVAGTRVELNIWDTAGQERFHALGPIYYRDSQGALLVYDITDEDSFLKVKNWVKELRRMLGDSVVLIIVGNKTDLNKDRRVTLNTAIEYAATVNAVHFECSAKNNVGIEEVFLDLTKRMIEKAKSGESGHQASASGAGRNRNILVVDDNQLRPEANKKGCC